MREQHLILGIGELLWDVLPDGAALGGAPANFTVMAGRLGNHAALLTRIGRDNLGQQAIDRLDPMPVDASSIQIDPSHETGRVTVTLADGMPSYIIHQPSAWDYLELTDEWVRLAERASALCFGSLAQRSAQSRQTIQTLVAQAPESSIRVFDVNLRTPFYSAEIIQESLELSTVLKLNDEEMPEVLSLLGLQTDDNATNNSLRHGADLLLEEFPSLALVAITRGSHGSLLVNRREWSEHPGFPVQLVDQIGAGDAFTAAITHYMLRGADLSTLNKAGNRWGAWVASQSGAMPPLSDAVRAAIEVEIGK